MTKHIRKSKALIDGVFRGLEAPADTFTVNRYPYPHVSEQEAIRSDWKRVGDEIRAAMTRANVKAAA
ncbi:MAG: hypothetical protein HY323_18040 [Betaproteobacteria bacterium]|nr:hypothetical protein [Betaproteobacteria bacterium]